MIFVDKTTVYLQAGSGGNGRVSFQRRKFLPKCGPDGGHGGRGGSIYFVADNNLNTLADIAYKKKYMASNGMSGGKENCSGHAGKDIKIAVPLGTQIMNAEGDLICDLMYTGDTFLAARGGLGGAGNVAFKSSTQQAPMHATMGGAGESGYFTLHFKIPAKVCLIGLPNVGKSSLLACSSRAKTPVSELPYTTSRPIPGFVLADNFDGFTMLDLPGIKSVVDHGTKEYHHFLAHLERCQIILHILSASSEDLIADYETTRNIILKQDTSWSSKAEFIAINKIDLVEKKELQQRIQAVNQHTGKQCYCVSTTSKSGVAELNLALHGYTSNTHI